MVRGSISGFVTVLSSLLVLSFLGCEQATLEPEQGSGAELATLFGATENGVCWRQTTTRGAGTIPMECPDGERSGLLCYPECNPGFTGVGPVCWEDCPQGYKDDGAFCRKDAVIIGADTSRCPWYDACGLTFAKNCSRCPKGYKNDGCTCRIDAHIFAKRSYGRGAGWGASCADGLERDASLCYPPCKPDYVGVGPVCWAKCSGDMPVDCGAGCAESTDACVEALKEQILSPIEAVMAGVNGEYLDLVLKAIDVFNAYNLPLCAAPSTSI
ncbi:MAG: hypothetical protein HY698_20695 [Deltaproteobacteria bacterium]|nr:hypothetical protein [Deltaproteobacteria bacterium]